MSFYESFAEISSDVLIAKANNFFRSVIAATITHPPWAATVQLFEGKSNELQINKLQLLFLNFKAFSFLLRYKADFREADRSSSPHSKIKAAIIWNISKVQVIYKHFLMFLPSTVTFKSPV